MTDLDLVRWLVVALAIVGPALAVLAVGAHGDGTGVDGAPPDNRTETTGPPGWRWRTT